MDSKLKILIGTKVHFNIISDFFPPVLPVCVQALSTPAPNWSVHLQDLTWCSRHKTKIMETANIGVSQQKFEKDRHRFRIHRINTVEV